MRSGIEIFLLETYTIENEPTRFERRWSGTATKAANVCDYFGKVLVGYTYVYIVFSDRHSQWSCAVLFCRVLPVIPVTQSAA